MNCKMLHTIQFNSIPRLHSAIRIVSLHFTFFFLFFEFFVNIWYFFYRLCEDSPLRIQNPRRIYCIVIDNVKCYAIQCRFSMWQKNMLTKVSSWFFCCFFVCCFCCCCNVVENRLILYTHNILLKLTLLNRTKMFFGFWAFYWHYIHGTWH